MTTQNFKECCTLPGRSDDASWNILQGGSPIWYYTSYQIGPRLEEPSDNLPALRIPLPLYKEVGKQKKLLRSNLRGHISYFKVSKSSVHEMTFKYYLVQCYALFLVHQLLPAPTSCRAKEGLGGGGRRASRKKGATLAVIILRLTDKMPSQKRSRPAARTIQPINISQGRFGWIHHRLLAHLFCSSLRWQPI